MRRVLGLTLTGLGAFLVVLAVMLRFYLPGQVIKFPLNEYLVTDFTGHASYFSQQQVKVLSNVSVRAVETVRGDVAAGSSSTAVWDEFTAVEDSTNNAPIQFVSQRSAFDRRTGVTTDCCGAYASVTSIGSAKGHQAGGLAFTWPIGTKKQAYLVYDPQLRKLEPNRYAGTATIQGMTAYKFVEQVTNQQVATQTVPGSLVGFPGLPTVTLPEYITETITVWVDPVTGTPLDATESRTYKLEDISGTTRLVVFQGSVAVTRQSVTNAVNTANSDHTKIALIQDIGPLVCLLLGVVLLAVGVTLTVSRRGSGEFAYESDETVGSAT